MQSHLITDLKEFGVLEDDYDLFLQKRADRVLKAASSTITSTTKRR